MFQFPQIQTTKSFLENAMLYDENVPLIATNVLESKTEKVPSHFANAGCNNGGASIRSCSKMTDSAIPNVQSQFERIPSPDLNLNLNVSRRYRMGGNDLNGSLKSNEFDQQREKRRRDCQQFLQPETFNRRSNCNTNPQRKLLLDNIHSLIQQRNRSRPQEPNLKEQQQYSVPPQQQSFHSQPRHYGNENGYASYQNVRPAPYQSRPNRPWIPRTTNNFNFINLPFNPQFHGCQQQIQQTFDYAQATARMAALKNYAKLKKQRIVPVTDKAGENNSDEIVVEFEGPPVDPKSIISKRKKRNSSINASTSTFSSNESVTSDGSSKTTSQQQSSFSSESRQVVRTQQFSSVNKFSQMPRKIIDPRNYELEDGEILDNDDCISVYEIQDSQNSHSMLEEQTTLSNEAANNSISSIYDPSNPLYDPLLDDDEPFISNPEDFALNDSIDLDDEDELLEDYETQQATKIHTVPEQVFSNFPNLQLTETTNEKMDD